jgi:hypothetical protein
MRRRLNIYWTPLSCKTVMASRDLGIIVALLLTLYGKA